MSDPSTSISIRTYERHDSSPASSTATDKIPNLSRYRNTMSIASELQVIAEMPEKAPSLSPETRPYLNPVVVGQGFARIPSRNKQLLQESSDTGSGGSGEESYRPPAKLDAVTVVYSITESPPESSTADAKKGSTSNKTSLCTCCSNYIRYCPNSARQPTPSTALSNSQTHTSSPGKRKYLTHPQNARYVPVVIPLCGDDHKTKEEDDMLQRMRLDLREWEKEMKKQIQKNGPGRNDEEEAEDGWDVVCPGLFTLRTPFDCGDDDYEDDVVG